MSSAFVDINRTLQALGMSDAPLQVSCLPSLALQWLMPRLSEFHRQQPNVPVRVKAEFQVLDRQAMETDDIDVAVRYDPVQYDRLHAEAILDEILFPVATPAYLAQHPAFAHGESLDGVVCCTTPPVGRARVRGVAHVAGGSPSGVGGRS